MKLGESSGVKTFRIESRGSFTETACSIAGFQWSAKIRTRSIFSTLRSGNSLHRAAWAASLLAACLCVDPSQSCARYRMA